LATAVDSGACIGGSTSSESKHLKAGAHTLFDVGLATILILPAVNGMDWNRPSKVEVDQIETLGNPGWNWANLEPVRRLRIQRTTAPPGL